VSITVAAPSAVLAYFSKDETSMIILVVGALLVFACMGAVLFGVCYAIWQWANPRANIYASRPPEFTHPCAPPAPSKSGLRWKCTVCGCLWIVHRHRFQIARTVAVGPGLPWEKQLEKRLEWVDGGLEWHFDHRAYAASKEGRGQI
jgi:hypothetical protein